MASNTNIVILSGNLVKDPELRYTQGGDAVCNFRIAVNSKFGEKEKTLWQDIVCWKGQAEAVANYLTKGSKVIVTGRLEERSAI